MRRRELPEIVVEYVVVDGPEGDRLAMRQGEAIREVLAWLHMHHRYEERNREPEGSADSPPHPSGPGA
ncbi:hypothetical protein ACH437_00475 [Streptomyces xinghaiensis]|uniref:hypothetical protein n=1 Tax=Streptomyces xinghaiensis TaxID=1038928 RepID=UPI0037891470